MPQMSPYNWLMLFFLFNMIIMFTTTFNHYNYKHNPLNLTQIPNKNFYHWMW